MNIAVYRILHHGARSWPPHAADRPAQRRAIRGALETIRLARAAEGGYVSIGQGGASVCYTKPGHGSCRLSGYSLAHCWTALAAMVAGVPWVDTRPVRAVGLMIGAPMIACGSPPSPRPWGGLAYAPRRDVFAYLRRLGAITGNEPDPLADIDEIDYLALRRRRA